MSNRCFVPILLFTTVYLIAAAKVTVLTVYYIIIKIDKRTHELTEYPVTRLHLALL